MKKILYVITLFLCNCNEPTCFTFKNEFRHYSKEIVIREKEQKQRDLFFIGLNKFNTADTFVINIGIQTIFDEAEINDTIVKPIDTTIIILKKRQKEIIYFYNCPHEKFYKPIIINH